MVPISKPNKDVDKGISCKPISLISVIAKTLEKSLLPYITANIPNLPTQHRYKPQHFTVTALHTVNHTVAKGFNQMVPPARTITVALVMSKAFDTINIHIYPNLLRTNIPVTIIKFVANYIKGRKTVQRLPPARGGTAQKKIFHLANRSQLIHPGPSSSLSRFFYGVE